MTRVHCHALPVIRSKVQESRHQRVRDWDHPAELVQLELSLWFVRRGDQGWVMARRLAVERRDRGCHLSLQQAKTVVPLVVAVSCRREHRTLPERPRSGRPSVAVPRRALQFGDRRHNPRRAKEYPLQFN